MNYPAYSEYKDSGVEWLGEVPDHWTIRNLGSLGQFEGGAGFPHAYQGVGTEEIPFYKVNALSRSIRDGTLTSTEDSVSRNTAAELGAKIIPPGAFVFAKVGAALLLGRVASLSSHSCIDNNMMAFMPGSHLAHTFTRYLLLQVPFSFLVNPGAVPSVNEGQMRRHRVPLPPPVEQSAIADFLDRETAKIDALIAKQEQLIATLREDRIATITHAVTKGLDPNAEMKDSGVEWLGEIPAHWSISRFSRHVTINEGQVDPRLPEYSDMPLIAPNHIESGTGRLMDVETASEQGADSGKYNVRRGQVIYSKIRPNLVKAVIAPYDALCSADMYGLEPDASLLSTDYLFYQILSQPFTDYAVDSSMRVAMPKVNRESLGAAPLWLPPVGEQRNISAFLAQRLEKVDRLQAKSRGIIGVLREYRSALITDAVTGKIDVRGAA